MGPRPDLEDGALKTLETLSALLDVAGHVVITFNFICRRRARHLLVRRQEFQSGCCLKGLYRFTH